MDLARQAVASGQMRPSAQQGPMPQMPPPSAMNPSMQKPGMPQMPPPSAMNPSMQKPGMPGTALAAAPRMKKGGSVKSRDGIAKRGKTKGRMC